MAARELGNSLGNPLARPRGAAAATASTNGRFRILPSQASTTITSGPLGPLIPSQGARIAFTYLHTNNQAGALGYLLDENLLPKTVLGFGYGANTFAPRNAQAYGLDDGRVFLAGYDPSAASGLIAYGLIDPKRNSAPVIRQTTRQVASAGIDSSSTCIVKDGFIYALRTIFTTNWLLEISRTSIANFAAGNNADVVMRIARAAGGDIERGPYLFDVDSSGIVYFAFSSPAHLLKINMVTGTLVAQGITFSENVTGTRGCLYDSNSDTFILSTSAGSILQVKGDFSQFRSFNTVENSATSLAAAGIFSFASNSTGIYLQARTTKNQIVRINGNVIDRYVTGPAEATIDDTMVLAVRGERVYSPVYRNPPHDIFIREIDLGTVGTTNVITDPVTGSTTPYLVSNQSRALPAYGSLTASTIYNVTSQSTANFFTTGDTAARLSAFEA